MNIIKSLLRYPAVTFIITAMAVAGGVHAFLNMPRTEDPSINIRAALIIAQYPGATSEQVEKQVTSVLEKQLFKFPEVLKAKTYSTSRPGLAVINVELEDYVTNVDAFWVKLRHSLNETRATELPPGIRGPILQSDFGDTVAMLIAVHGDRYGFRELRDYTNQVQDKLRTVRDVGKMVTYGEQGEQIWITGSLDRLAQYFSDPVKAIKMLQQRNAITGSGNVDVGEAKVPLRATGVFTAEDQIKNVLIDISPKTGQPVYMRDVATVERRYKDPTFLVRYDGRPCILLSVEMQKGRNIAQLGDEISEVFRELRTQLPPDVKIDLIANQPKVVKDRISGLSYEFLMAIAAVILVTMILLPIRVATIAAVAIPVTLFITMGVMNAFGIQLHQVSISSLIVILGIVVDDAIVIADNYLVLLDQNLSPEEVLRRSVADVVVPVLTATVTIICSFLPLLILTGYVGEFIRDLPLTVGIALTVSFLVAVCLTPLLCRIFIPPGTYSHAQGDTPKSKKQFHLLDGLQRLYQKAIVFLMKRKSLAILLGFLAVAGGALLFVVLPQQFFPSAERNQFVIEVWMKPGSRIEATDAVMKRIEADLMQRKEVAHMASFVGQSAPRFYYNVNVNQPDGAYGQMIVNTRSVKATTGLVYQLRDELARLAPEALVIVKELQQGAPLTAPLEVRISGADISELKRIGSEVEGILRASPFSQYVHHDYFNDSYLVDIRVDTELANRLGLTNAYISNVLTGAFDGAPISIFWEGDRLLPIMLRMNEDNRSSFANVSNTYVTSPVTQAGVPLRSFATLKPEWQTSRIVRRNGVRTLTVQAFVKEGYYGSELLKAAAPKIAALPLPAGYRIEYGGEQANQDDTFPRMLGALAISLTTIFLVLLIQFRSVADPLIIMSSIPLALLGSAVGLLVTRNPFGFTAFMGLVSLCGIVVRNAIILIDYINEKLALGKSLEEAATEAGQRRLRPIFLTTMAAAVGVTPMIVSRSTLWSPLASVIAVGLIFSMFFTLLVVPVLFVLVKSRTRRKTAVPAILMIVAAVLLIVPGKALAETKTLTLQAAVDCALTQNTALKIAKSKVRESDEKRSAARADYFPQVSNTTLYSDVTNQNIYRDPTGISDRFPVVTTLTSPVLDLFTPDKLFLTSTAVVQPVTQLLKIYRADRAAFADRQITQNDFKAAQREVVFGVQRLYFGILIAQKQKAAARASVQAAEETLQDAQNAYQSGNVLEVSVIGSRAQLLQNRQALLVARIQESDLTAEMNNVLGFPPDTELILEEPAAQDENIVSRDEYLKSALLYNPEIRNTRETITKAKHGVEAAYYSYIPDISLFARYTYQDTIPWIERNIGSYGVLMTWNLFDWGKRHAVIGQRKEQLEQARLNQERIEKRLSVDVEKAYRKLEQTRMLMDAAREALAMQNENQRISADRLQAGVITQAKYAEAVAFVKKAEADELQAKLAYQLALADIQRIAASDLSQN